MSWQRLRCCISAVASAFLDSWVSEKDRPDFGIEVLGV